MSSFFKSILILSLSYSVTLASDFVDYKTLATKLVKESKKNGLYATSDDVKKALKSKDSVVVDVRTKEEWTAAHIQGSYRVGREAPEKALANFVLDENDKFVKDKLIVVCNSAKRASIEAETFKQMGFKEVKIYDIYSWIDECNPFATSYSAKKDKSGTGNKFGSFYAEHCKK